MNAMLAATWVLILASLALGVWTRMTINRINRGRPGRSPTTEESFLLHQARAWLDAADGNMPRRDCLERARRLLETASLMSGTNESLSLTEAKAAHVAAARADR